MSHFMGAVNRVLFFMSKQTATRSEEKLVFCSRWNKSVIVELRNITRKRFIPMTQLTTELLNFLAQKQDVDNNRMEKLRNLKILS